MAVDSMWVFVGIGILIMLSIIKIIANKIEDRKKREWQKRKLGHYDEPVKLGIFGKILVSLGIAKLKEK